MSKKRLIKKLDPVDVLSQIYLSNLKIQDDLKPTHAQIGFTAISEFGCLNTIWRTLGNKTNKTLYKVNHALHVIETYMIMNDYEKVMNFYLKPDPAVFKSPIILGKIPGLKEVVILDGNHRVCAYWKLYKERKIEFSVPSILFTFKRTKCLTK